MSDKKKALKKVWKISLMISEVERRKQVLQQIHQNNYL